MCQRKSLFVLFLFATLGMCGCGSISSTPSFSQFGEGPLPTGDSMIPMPTLVESEPQWANEAPCIDLFGDSNPHAPLEPSPFPTTEVAVDDLGATPAQTSFSMKQISVIPEDCQPRDEYVHDGGDRGAAAVVRKNWEVDGLQMEDTIGHFDTLRGDTEVVASTRSCVYSPRFAATRQVVRVHQNRTSLAASRARILDRIVQQESTAKFGAVKQPIASVRAVGTDIGTTVEEHQLGLTVDDIDRPTEETGMVIPYRDLAVVARGVMEVDEQESVLHYANAAHAWSDVKMAQVTILGMVPTETTNLAASEAAVVYRMPRGKARLRLLKLASAEDALIGETIEFTLKFDNVGDEPIGNVTIIDTLTTRLVYEEASQDCSVDADFFAEEAGGSPALRWEIAEPLDPGEGGVITFKCKVR